VPDKALSIGKREIANQKGELVTVGEPIMQWVVLRPLQRIF
jgi:hypothetical protein